MASRSTKFFVPTHHLPPVQLCRPVWPARITAWIQVPGPAGALQGSLLRTASSPSSCSATTSPVATCARCSSSLAVAYRCFSPPLLGLSNGYLSTLALIYGPKIVPRELAGGHRGGDDLLRVPGPGAWLRLLCPARAPHLGRAMTGLQCCMAPGLQQGIGAGSARRQVAAGRAGLVSAGLTLPEPGCSQGSGTSAIPRPGRHSRHFSRRPETFQDQRHLNKTQLPDTQSENSPPMGVTVIFPLLGLCCQVGESSELLVGECQDCLSHFAFSQPCSFQLMARFETS